MSFVHLHVHSQYSILDGASPIKSLFQKAHKYGQPALALTDHGYMYGVKEFLRVAADYPDVKPIVGCEVYVALEDRHTRRGKIDQKAYHLILLAKNITGYHNLVKLCSLGNIEGFYFHPRIDRELIEKYHEGLICTTACLGGEVPRRIMEGNMEAAEEAVLWYKSIFGEDYYLEVQSHPTDLPLAPQETFEKQQIVNEALYELAKKHDIKVIATNDVHFVDKEDGPAHDRLICLTFNNNVDDPDRLRYTQQEYFKSKEEMAALFPDHPEVLSNTLEIADKVELYSIDSDPILPHFPIPEEYKDSNEYLRYLTYKGAEIRYGKEIPQNIRDRIDFELETIQKMGFPDYFLIVQDFIAAARNMGVSVGPGRGSAAGSVVAYCLKITNIDPIKYDLLFERFLNPDRISMPDIDIDFDDEGRSKVFEYVEKKYGKDHVAHVVTFGTMATKSAIRDVARIEQVPLQEADRLSKLVPRSFEIDAYDKTESTSLVKVEVPPTVKLCVERIQDFKDALNSDDKKLSNTIKYAQQLEGSIRQTGVHACALIIGREDLTNIIPITVEEDKESKEKIWVSQYEGSYIEQVGMLKMDFLGLKTLSIIKETMSNIVESGHEPFDIEAIPIDDPLTYKLFSKGNTTAVFQFESDGMKKWLRELHPTRFEDLIAMNALYRPGPMEYIPDFVARKHGKQEITYDLKEMEEHLEDTYGITVYQEQVMRLSQELAGFSPGMADTLRKAMGKKQLSVMEKLNDQFMEGGLAKGHPQEILEKIWKDWKSFAEYAFNKSHATCYAWVGYQTGYLKAHYPAQFLAANLSKNLNDIEEITKLMDDCKRMKIEVLGPDINESRTTFTVNKKGNIRFGMAGIKGVGTNVIDAIIEERERGGAFTDIFDFVERLPSGVVNRRVIECLIYSGSFDSFSDMHRTQYFLFNNKDESFIDALLKYTYKYQSDTVMQGGLFGDTEEMKPVRPEVPPLQEYDEIELLKKEKELVGMYISSHPLDKFRFEFDNLVTVELSEVRNIEDNLSRDPKLRNIEFTVGGLVTDVQVKYTRTGNRPWCTFTVEDFNGSHTFSLSGKSYEAYMPYMVDHTALLIRCVTKELFRKEDVENRKAPEYRLFIANMTLLSNAKEQFFKEFHISMDLEQADADFRKALTKKLRVHKGETPLFIDLSFDHNGGKETVSLYSNKFRVSVDGELVDWLYEQGLDCRAVKKMNW